MADYGIKTLFNFSNGTTPLTASTTSTGSAVLTLTPDQGAVLQFRAYVQGTSSAGVTFKIYRSFEAVGTSGVGTSWDTSPFMTAGLGTGGTKQVSRLLSPNNVVNRSGMSFIAPCGGRFKAYCTNDGNATVSSYRVLAQTFQIP